MKILRKFTDAVYRLFFWLSFFISMIMNNAWLIRRKFVLYLVKVFLRLFFFLRSFYLYFYLAQSFVAFFFFYGCKLVKLISIHCQPFFFFSPAFHDITIASFETGIWMSFLTLTKRLLLPSVWKICSLKNYKLGCSRTILGLKLKRCDVIWWCILAPHRWR